MSSRIEQIIQEIEEYVDSCKFQPLSTTKIVVNKEEIEEYLRELRLKTPDEIKRYQKIISNRDAILADAKAKADAMIEEAQVQTTELVSEHEIMQQAYAQANEIRPLMKRIAVLSEKYHCAVILIGHMNKNSNGKSSYRGLGSIDFQAAARSVLIVGRVKDEPEVRVVCHTKSSLAPEGTSIAFRLDKNNGFNGLENMISVPMNFLMETEEDRKVGKQKEISP
mgnify:CR=1 FL=1